MAEDIQTPQGTSSTTGGSTPARKPGTFYPGDPRRINRPAGPNKSTLAAQQLLRDKAGELVQKLLDMTEEMRTGEPCPLCRRGMLRDEDVRIKALIAALDRGGLGPTSKVEMIEKPDMEWVEYATAEEAQQLWVIVESCRARMPINDGPGQSEETALTS